MSQSQIDWITYKLFQEYEKQDDEEHARQTLEKEGKGITVGDDSAGLGRHFELFGSEFENGGERGCFRNAKPEKEK